MKECKHDNIQMSPTLDTVGGLDDNYNIVCKDCKKIFLEDINKERAFSIIKDTIYRSMD